MNAPHRKRENLASLLKSTLEERNMTAKQLAVELKTSLNNVKRWLTCQSFPRDDMMCKIASELDITIYRLYNLVS